MASRSCISIVLHEPCTSKTWPNLTYRFYLFHFLREVDPENHGLQSLLIVWNGRHLCMGDRDVHSTYACAHTHTHLTREPVWWSQCSQCRRIVIIPCKAQTLCVERDRNEKINFHLSSHLHTSFLLGAKFNSCLRCCSDSTLSSHVTTALRILSNGSFKCPRRIATKYQQESGHNKLTR